MTKIVGGWKRFAHMSIAAGLFVDPAPRPVLASYGVDKSSSHRSIRAMLQVALTAKAINLRETEEIADRKRFQA